MSDRPRTYGTTGREMSRIHDEANSVIHYLRNPQKW